MSEVEELLMKEKQGYTDKNRKKKEKKSAWAATIAIVLSLVAGFASLYYLAGASYALRSNRLKYDAAVSYLGSYKTALVVISALVVLAVLFLVKALSKRQAVGACVLSVIILILTSFTIFSGISTCKSFEKAFEQDEDLGASKIGDAVEMYVDALRSQDADELEDILEENLNLRYTSHTTGINEDAFTDLADSLNELNLNWNHCDYEVVDRYDDDDGCECCTVEISIPLQGTFTDDSIMYQPCTISASFHRINGRWFFGDHND